MARTQETVGAAYAQVKATIEGKGGTMKSRSLRHIGGGHFVTSAKDAQGRWIDVDAYRTDAGGWLFEFNQ